jgi:hypothetical protein
LAGHLRPVNSTSFDVQGHRESAIDSASSNAGRDRETYHFAPLYETAYAGRAAAWLSILAQQAPYGKLSSSAIDAGVQIFFCDHASPWQRPTNAKKAPKWPAALSFGERSAAAARRR